MSTSSAGSVFQPCGTLLARPFEAKRDLRRRIRAERAERPQAVRAWLADLFARVMLENPEIALARTVGLYASMPTEPGTEPLRQALRATGAQVLLPVVLEDLSLDWAEDTGVTVPARKMGGPEPVGPRLGPSAVATLDVIIVPALAVDTLGHRLGQGAGCYDRALRELSPGVCVVAMVHDEELHDAAVEPVPTEPHDHPVHVAVTPSRWMHLA